MTGDWIVGKLRNGSEASMSRRLEEIGVEAYCPMERQKGPRRRGENGREAIERPALPGYLPIKEATVARAETWEWLDREGDFYDFIRDVNNEFARMVDEDLNPLRRMEQAEIVKFVTGPLFYMGQTVMVPMGNPYVNKSWWSMIGQIVSVKNGRYCLGGGHFPKETWFSGLQLLEDAV